MIALLVQWLQVWWKEADEQAELHQGDGVGMGAASVCSQWIGRQTAQFRGVFLAVSQLILSD